MKDYVDMLVSYRVLIRRHREFVNRGTEFKIRFACLHAVCVTWRRNMNIQTLILDDDCNSALAARTALADYPDVEIIGHFTHTEELLAFLEKHTADLLFLDIELDKESGFDAAHRLRRDYPWLMIVFLTGHSSYAIGGYDFHPVNFLTKPIHHAKLRQTIAEVRRRMEQSHEQRSTRLMFRLQQSGYRILDVRDIYYIERMHRKNYMYTAEGVLRIANYTMRELDEMLTEHGFFLCHQSYLISLYRIESVKDIGRQLYEAKLRGCENPLPISRNRYEKLLEQLKAIGLKTF